ncbi:MAG: glucoamylase family protein [Bacteroidota bacterium]|nr:glucoamylase family protein [Bacteroidota bacterium]MDP4217516.1 glucoamylase family protein [Bacteroidota bacterium]MDP4246985.1 glucoamylase family protein [Bacteroidota bacterium]MDP4260573.1 glucoamylase family protein [Bacteroidota bacterium]
MKKYLLGLAVASILFACKKNSGNGNQPTTFLLTYTVNGVNNGTGNYTGVSTNPVFVFSFTSPVQQASLASHFSLADNLSNPVTVNITMQRNDSMAVVTPSKALSSFSKYSLAVTSGLTSTTNASLLNPLSITLSTAIDSSNKFPAIADTALLTLIQQQTFKYFWDFGHPNCGMARERDNGDNDVVTTGGSGFGIMAMIVAANRGFISRQDAVLRLNTIAHFLTTKCQRWHGAYSHWINGSTGATVPFGNNNGADIVETSYLMEGLLTARQYFNTADANEIALRDSINSIWNAVEWNWFTQNGAASNIFWQYNPSYTLPGDIWSIPVSGWNEALITYALAASSPTYPIRKGVYDSGWAKTGAIRNGTAYYGITLPLGQAYGGPLFFAHYSFMGINPTALSDAWCSNYFTQNAAHAQINYTYCVTNPLHQFGYSNMCWGLTASDIPSGYTASSPTNDVGVIAPTAAISSLPYTPTQSMNAIRFFYYTIGDKIWGNYGFADAFDLNTPWFASSHLAIDEGPIICMIENYRSGLLWNLFMSCPEVKTGMKNIGFASPNL